MQHATVTQMTKDSDFAGQELGPDIVSAGSGARKSATAATAATAQLSFQIDVPFSMSVKIHKHFITADIHHFSLISLSGSHGLTFTHFKRNLYGAYT